MKTTFAKPYSPRSEGHSRAPTRSRDLLQRWIQAESICGVKDSYILQFAGANLVVFDDVGEKCSVIQLSNNQMKPCLGKPFRCRVRT